MKHRKPWKVLVYVRAKDTNDKYLSYCICRLIQRGRVFVSGAGQRLPEVQVKVMWPKYIFKGKESLRGVLLSG